MENKDKEMMPVVNNSPAEMIKAAIAGGASLEKMEKFIELQERWEATQAKKAYHLAMSEFKANPPKIEKDQKVSFGNTHYNHASLANVVEKISAELSKHGLSAAWITKQNGVIEVTCRITHVLGHSEETSLSAEADSSGSKNKIQAIGSTITYLQRYTLLALTGLATSEQDDDGNSAGSPVEYITEEQVSIILDLLTVVGGEDIAKTEASFCKFMKVEKLELMPQSDYQRAITALGDKKKALEAKKAGKK